jgi:hypothetical protein
VSRFCFLGGGPLVPSHLLYHGTNSTSQVPVLDNLYFALFSSLKDKVENGPKLIQCICYSTNYYCTFTSIACAPRQPAVQLQHLCTFVRYRREERLDCVHGGGAPGLADRLLAPTAGQTCAVGWRLGGRTPDTFGCGHRDAFVFYKQFSLGLSIDMLSASGPLS